MDVGTAVPEHRDADPPAPGRPADELAPFAAKPVVAIAASAVAVLTFLNSHLGFHGDELYLGWLGGRAAWGYVDQPPVVPLVAHAIDAVSGHSLVAMRLLASLVVGWLVVAGALIARELGGSRRAQVLAAFAMACVPATRAPAVIWGGTAADMCTWAVVLLLTTRLVRTADAKYWMWIGLAVGIGVEVKWSVLVLVAAFAVGLLAGPQRRLLWSPRAFAGGAVAVALWLPNLWWNATHDWAFLEYTAGVADKNAALGRRLTFFPIVGLLLTGAIAAPLAWRGWQWLRAGRFRPFAIAMPLAVVLVFVTGGRLYYLGPTAIPLFAAAAVLLDRAGEAERRRGVTVLACTALLTVPLTTTVLPAGALNTLKPLNPYLLDMVGWPELVDEVERAYAAIPAGDLDTAVVLAENFASGAALEHAAPALPVYSPEHDFWYLGPPADDRTTVLTVGFDAADVATWCAGARQVGTITNHHDVHNAQEGWPLLMCTRMRAPWSAIWDDLRSFG